VLVNQNGALQTVRVRTGASSETMTEIIGGELKEGDAVVVFPPSDGLGNPRLMMGQQGDNNNPPNPFR
jgi:multidrug efflux pump subunit AcrA (membrane-fusion protein)